ncbi:hypothetical protein [Pseudonocardia oroxyli]|uniref:Uncharacterized protein n=1 Tax=Pseudonocardia oroxyli TaxID=366584 RepID=A0A1G7T0Z6_PSEOR|nr:hypothetical protein [Pseudonocardia oroxyli]SDG28250.1 hypothetical protein SAMN05216377_110144 [Pseudonocardia oroxyli]
MSDNSISVNDWSEPEQDLVPLTRGEAVELIAEQTGRSREVAESMVRDYLDDTSTRLGYSVHRWGLDSGDVAEIRRDYEWIDYEAGENPADARARAAVNAAGWATTAAAVDREHSPGYTARADLQAAMWAERAEDGWSA